MTRNKREVGYNGLKKKNSSHSFKATKRRFKIVKSQKIYFSMHSNALLTSLSNALVNMIKSVIDIFVIIKTENHLKTN